MPTKAELQAEVARLSESLRQFTDPEHHRLVSFVDGTWSFKSPIFPIFVNTAAQMLGEVDAKNYIEMRANHHEVGPIVVTVQKERGKTPHDLREEALAVLRELVRLKDLKDGGEMHPLSTYGMDYEQSKPKAWAEARRLVAPSGEKEATP